MSEIKIYITYILDLDFQITLHVSEVFLEIGDWTFDLAYRYKYFVLLSLWIILRGV